MAEQKITWSAKHLKQEVEYFLKDKIGRIWFMRMMYESFQIFTPNYENNASVYAKNARQAAGLEMYNLAKEIDVKKVNLAEKEYNEMLALSVKKQKEDSNNE